MSAVGTLSLDSILVTFRARWPQPVADHGRQTRTPAGAPAPSLRDGHARAKRNSEPCACTAAAHTVLPAPSRRRTPSSRLPWRTAWYVERERQRGRASASASALRRSFHGVAPQATSGRQTTSVKTHRAWRGAIRTETRKLELTTATSTRGPHGASDTDRRVQGKASKTRRRWGCQEEGVKRQASRF